MVRNLPIPIARFLTAALTLSSCASVVRAQIVPDDFPTIQAAFASGAEQVAVRPGFYPERPVLDRPFVIRGLIPTGSTDLTEIAGLLLDDANQHSSHSAYVTIVDVRIRGLVLSTFHLGMHSGPLTLGFLRCVLDSGLTDDSASVNSQHEWQFVRCTINGPVRLRWPDRAGFTDNVFTAGASIGAKEAVGFDGNRFEGAGPVAIDVVPGCEDVSIVSNAVRGFDVGIRAGRTDFIATANTLEGCAAAGIRADHLDGASISRNLLRACGGGIVVDHFEGLALEGNCIEDGAGGIAASGGNTLILNGNQIRRCGTGISGSGEEVRSSDNRVESCGGGISLFPTTGTPLRFGTP